MARNTDGERGAGALRRKEKHGVVAPGSDRAN